MMRARETSRFLAVDQVTDHIKASTHRAPPRDRCWLARRQQLVEHRGRPAERGEGTFEIERRSRHGSKVQQDRKDGNWSRGPARRGWRHDRMDEVDSLPC
jgi:hypothetical protein